MTNKTLGFILIGGGLLYLFMRRGATSGGGITGERSALLAWNSSTDSQASNDYFHSVVNQLADSEVDTVYHVIFDYVSKGLQVPAGSQLYTDMQAISTKYNIFT